MMPDSVRRAGFEGEGLELGEALFEAILERESGLVFTVDDYDETWKRVANPDRARHALDPRAARRAAPASRDEPEAARPGLPVRAVGRRAALAHGEHDLPRSRLAQDGCATARCASTPTTRERLGIADGGRARLTTKRGSVETVVEVTDTLQPGYVTLPNGLGTRLSRTRTAASGCTACAPNELTSSEDRDWLAGTPHHKHVPARIEAA